MKRATRMLVMIVSVVAFASVSTGCDEGLPWSWTMPDLGNPPGNDTLHMVGQFCPPGALCGTVS